MYETKISLPELGLVGGTRAVLGLGLGLLLAGRMSDDQRRAVGWSLFLVGALSTVPLAFDVLGKADRRLGLKPAVGGRSPSRGAGNKKPTGGQTLPWVYEKRWSDHRLLSTKRSAVCLGDRLGSEPAGKADGAVPRVPLTLDLIGRVTALARPVREENVGPCVTHAVCCFGYVWRRPRFGTIRRETATVTNAPTVALSIFGRTPPRGAQKGAKLACSGRKHGRAIRAGKAGRLFRVRVLPGRR